MKIFGLRNIKTAIAVFICLNTSLLLILLFGEPFAITWFSPFFAGIATAYSVQSSNHHSATLARNRAVGSIIGGFYGLLICLIFENASFLSKLDPLFHRFIFFIIISIAILPLILLTIKVKQANATFITILTYLSVTISIRNNLPVTFFAFNRIISTIYGVLIALFINQFRLPRHKNKDILFVSGLDGTLLQKDQHLSGFSKYRLNHLIDRGANITIATTRTPSSLFEIIQDVHFELPLIIMNGAAIYDTKTKSYQNIRALNQEAKNGISLFLKSHSQYAFIYAIIDDTLAVYHTELPNPAQKKFYNDRKNDFFKNNIRGEVDLNESIIYYILIDQCDIIRAMQKELKACSYSSDISIHVYPFEDMQGYCYMKINNRDSSKQSSISYLVSEYHLPRVVALGAKNFDIPMMITADYSIALTNADPEVKAIADLIIPSDQPNDMVQMIEKIFHTKNFDILNHILNKHKTHSK
ncbi:MAG: HAD hydrolase family protein [Bacilli bacterium]